jgi:hypothetical protein
MSRDVGHGHRTIAWMVDDDEEKPAAPPLSMMLRAGVACALLGIVIGGILGFHNLPGIARLFEVPSYGHFMLPSLVFGGVAVGLSIAELVQTGRYMPSLRVFALGVTAMVTPLLLGIALAVVIVGIIFTVLSEM